MGSGANPPIINAISKSIRRNEFFVFHFWHTIHPLCACSCSVKVTPFSSPKIQTMCRHHHLYDAGIWQNHISVVSGPPPEGMLQKCPKQMPPKMEPEYMSYESSSKNWRRQWRSSDQHVRRRCFENWSNKWMRVWFWGGPYVMSVAVWDFIVWHLKAWSCNGKMRPVSMYITPGAT